MSRRKSINEGLYGEPVNSLSEIIDRLDIELDRKRMDMRRNTEWWWKCLYDENGEIGDQSDWDGSSYFFLKLREFFGLSWRKSQQKS